MLNFHLVSFEDYFMDEIQLQLDNIFDVDQAYDDSFRKSKYLVSAKYAASYQEAKIFTVAICDMWNNKCLSLPNGNYLFRRQATELLKEVGCKGGSFYNNLFLWSQELAHRTYSYYDPSLNAFSVHSLIVNGGYNLPAPDGSNKTGEFWLELNGTLLDILKPNKDFIIESKKLCLSFPNDAFGNYAYRIYELLKTKCYYPSNYEGEKSYIFSTTIGLAELKLTIGVVNAEHKAVREILQTQNGKPDYEAAVAAAPESEVQFPRWIDFKKRVLDRATETINDLTSMKLSYTPNKSGRSHKIESITFIMDLSNNYPDSVKNNEVMDNDTNDLDIGDKLDQINTVQISEEEKDEIIDKISDLIDEPLKIKDLRVIAEKAEYNFDKVSKAYGVLKKSKNKIDNVTGFMIKAIENEYDMPVSKEAKSSHKEKSYDYYNSFDYIDWETKHFHDSDEEFIRSAENILGCSLTDEEKTNKPLIYQYVENKFKGLDKSVGCERFLK